MEILVKAFTDQHLDGMYASIDTVAKNVNFTPEQLQTIKDHAYRIELRFEDGNLYGVYNIVNGKVNGYNHRMADEKEISYLALLGISV